MDNQVIGAYFNGKWGRQTSRRIWLRHNSGGWEVQAREGDSDQPSRFWDLPTEELARGLVEHLQQPDADDPNDGWRDLSDLY